MLAATMGRLYNSAFYALEDTRTPLKFALVRFTLTLVLRIPVRDSAAASDRESHSAGAWPA